MKNNINDNINMEKRIIKQLKIRKNIIQEEIGKNRQNKKYTKKDLLINTTLLSLLFIIIAYGVTFFIAFMYAEIIDFDSIEFIKVMSKIVGIVYIPPSIIISLITNIINGSVKNKKYKKLKGYEVELEELNKKLVESQTKLNLLKENKINNEIDNKNNDYLEQLKLLRDKLKLYREIGYNEDRYLRYYEDDHLELILGIKYTKEQLDEIKKYFEEKGPSLVKKK